MKKNYFLLTLFLVLTFCAYGAQKPIVAEIGNQTALVGKSFYLQVPLTAADPSATFTLIESLPGMTINSTTGVIYWKPVALSSGGQVTVSASNTEGESVQSFFVFVSETTNCASGVQSYWNMQGHAGNALVDMSGANDASIDMSANVKDTIGISGKALVFSPLNKSAKFAQITNGDAFDFSRDDSVSISLWFKSNGKKEKNEVLIARGIASFWLIKVSDTLSSRKVVFQALPNADPIPPIFTLVNLKSVEDKDWHHVVLVFNGNGNNSKVDLYVDEQVVSSSPGWNKGGFDLNGAAQIGWWSKFSPVNYPFNGVIDELAFFNKGLTSADVSALKSKGDTGKGICIPDNYKPIFNYESKLAFDEKLFVDTVSYALFGGSLVPTFAATILPSWLSFDAAKGILSGTPHTENVGDTIVKIKLIQGAYEIEKEFVLTVKFKNIPPVLVNIPDVFILSEQDTFSLTLNYSDANVGDVLTPSVAMPAWLTFNPTSKTISGIPPQNPSLNKKDTIDYAIKIVITDLASDSAIDQAVIRVFYINDAPVVNSQSPIVIDEDSTYTLTPAVLQVTDIDNVYPDDHTITIKPGDNYTFNGLIIKPVENFYGVLSLPIEVSDGDSIATFNLTITVNSVNDAPKFTTQPIKSIVFDNAYKYTFAALDVEDDSSLTYRVDTIPAWLTYNEGTLSIEGTPAEINIGKHRVVIKAFDTEMDSATQAFTIVVKAVNSAPVITSTPVLTINEDELYTYTIVASDVDDEDVLEYSAVKSPAWLVFDVDTKVLSGTPLNEHVGNNEVILRVSDGILNTDQTFTIKVVNVNDAPEITKQLKVINIASDSTVLITIDMFEVVDVDNVPSALSLSVQGGENYTVNGNQVTPTDGFTGKLLVNVAVSDGSLSSEVFLVELNVISVSVQKVRKDLIIRVYPNPATDGVYLDLNVDQDLTLQIFTIEGKEITNDKIAFGTTRYFLNTSNYTAGMYIVKLYGKTLMQTAYFSIK